MNTCCGCLRSGGDFWSRLVCPAFGAFLLTIACHASPGQDECCEESGQPYPFVENGKIGVMMGDGRVVAEPEYDFPVHYHRDAGVCYTATVQADKDEWAAIRDQNAVLGQRATVYFDEAECFPPTSPESCLISRNGLLGFVLEDGTTIAPRYRAATLFRNGCAWVQDEDGYCLIDRKGAKISARSDRVRAREQWGVIDTEGTAVATSEYAKPSETREGSARTECVAVARGDGGYGLVDSHGKWIVKPEYNSIGAVESDGLRYAYGRDGVGRLSPSGEVVVPCRYSYLGKFRCGLALACRDAAIALSGDVAAGTWEYVNRQGEVVDPRRD